MTVDQLSHEQPNGGPNAGDLFGKLSQDRQPETPRKKGKYIGRHAAKPFVPEGPTRQDIKDALTADERRNLKQASKIVNRLLGATAFVPVTGNTVPLEPKMQRGTFTDEAVTIATERLSNVYGADVVVEDSVPTSPEEQPYDAQYDYDTNDRPHRVIRVAGINDNANNTPTSHRK
jgi:hypothetical protein